MFIGVDRIFPFPFQHQGRKKDKEKIFIPIKACADGCLTVWWRSSLFVHSQCSSQLLVYAVATVITRLLFTNWLFPLKQNRLTVYSDIKVNSRRRDRWIAGTSLDNTRVRLKVYAKNLLRTIISRANKQICLSDEWLQYKEKDKRGGVEWRKKNNINNVGHTAWWKLAGGLSGCMSSCLSPGTNVISVHKRMKNYF